MKRADRSVALQSRERAARVGLVAVATAAVVAVAGGREFFWLCVPAALLGCSLARSRGGAALASAVVLGAAAVPLAVSRDLRPFPQPLLAVLVPLASTAILVSVRERLDRERAALREFALRDPLTGVANRRALYARADYERARHIRARRRFALMMLDLDGFKLLNDRFGHAAGDDLLREVAVALRRVVRAQDTVARVGGDEFCVLAPETGRGGALQLTTRIDAALRRAAAGIEALEGSIGVAVFPDDGRDVDTLMAAADLRLLDIKRERQRGRPQRRAA